ncbi:MAG: hypothetical protein JWQ71_783 [Pedosphaera sp.]|nr:hypothetical protein [Pedosphaera sp.]
MREDEEGVAGLVQPAQGIGLRWCGPANVDSHGIFAHYT